MTILGTASIYRSSVSILSGVNYQIPDILKRPLPISVTGAVWALWALCCQLALVRAVIITTEIEVGLMPSCVFCYVLRTYAFKRYQSSACQGTSKVISVEQCRKSVRRSLWATVRARDLNVAMAIAVVCYSLTCGSGCGAGGSGHRFVSVQYSSNIQICTDKCIYNCDGFCGIENCLLAIAVWRLCVDPWLAGAIG